MGEKYGGDWKPRMPRMPHLDPHGYAWWFAPPDNDGDGESVVVDDDKGEDVDRQPS